MISSGGLLVLAVALFILGTVARLIVGEVIKARAYTLAPALVARAVRRVPEARREVREEEWTDQVDLLLSRSLPIAAVRFAVGCNLGAARMQRAGVERAKRHLWRRIWRALLAHQEMATAAFLSGLFGAMSTTFLEVVQGGSAAWKTITLATGSGFGALLALVRLITLGGRLSDVRTLFRRRR